MYDFCFLLIFLCVDYVRPLKKPVRARYCKGLFTQVPYRDGTVYNVSIQSNLELESCIYSVFPLFLCLRILCTLSAPLLRGTGVYSQHPGDNCWFL